MTYPLAGYSGSTDNLKALGHPLNNASANTIQIPRPVVMRSQPNLLERETRPRRKRDIRNSRLFRSGRNPLFSKRGPNTGTSRSSVSAATVSVVLTSEISERPTSTLSTVPEVSI